VETSKFSLAAKTNVGPSVASLNEIVGFLPTNLHRTLVQVYQWNITTEQTGFPQTIIMDKIIIKNIRCHGILGINPEERINKQPILVNITMQADTQVAASSQNINDAVNYFEVAMVVKHFVENAAALLVETLVNDLAEMILEQYETVESVKVRVEKPEAVEFADSVGVEVVRQRTKTE